MCSRWGVTAASGVRKSVEAGALTRCLLIGAGGGVAPGEGTGHQSHPANFAAGAALPAARRVRPHNRIALVQAAHIRLSRPRSFPRLAGPNTDRKSVPQDRKSVV